MKKNLLLFSFSLLLFPQNMFAPLFPDSTGTVSCEVVGKSPDSLKNFCLNRCIKIMQDDNPSLPSENFNEEWQKILPVDLKEEFQRVMVNNYLKLIKESIAKAKFDSLKKKTTESFNEHGDEKCSLTEEDLLFVEFDSLFKRLFEKQLKGVTDVKRIRYLFFFKVYHDGAQENLIYYERAQKNLRDLVLELAEGEEEKKFINSYFTTSISCFSHYQTDPYCVAFHLRAFSMIDYLVDIGIDYAKVYTVAVRLTEENEEPVRQSLLTILQEDTDPNDIEMQNYLTEKFGIEFNEEEEKL